MAFVKLKTQGDAIHIEKGTKVQGYLMGCRIIPGKKKGDKPSVLLLMKAKNGQPLEVWANGVIKYAVLAESGKGIKEEFRGVMMRFTGGGTTKLDKGRAPMRETEIEIDSSDVLKSGTGKDYVLDRKPRKFKK